MVRKVHETSYQKLTSCGTALDRSLQDCSWRRNYGSIRSVVAALPSTEKCLPDQAATSSQSPLTAAALLEETAGHDTSVGGGHVVGGANA